MTTTVKKLHKAQKLYMSDQRLCRTEDKLDKLSEAVYAIARMEERNLTVLNRLEHIYGSNKKMDDRMDEIESRP